jgi:hypothetical protein
MIKTLIEIAVDRLHKAGYRASPSNTYGGYINVLVPVDGGHSRVTIHHTELYSFLNARA